MPSKYAPKRKADPNRKYHLQFGLGIVLIALALAVAFWHSGFWGGVVVVLLVAGLILMMRAVTTYNYREVVRQIPARDIDSLRF